MKSMESLKIKDLERYSRHLLLPEVGRVGQEKLLNARVLIIGVGGLGSPVSLYLAAAGVRNIGLIDVDSVDISNLQRQIVHNEKTVGKSKVLSASDRLKELDKDMSVTTYNERFSEINAEDIIDEWDVIVDCLDNFTGKLLINDVCHFTKKPWVHGGVLRFGGQVTTFDPRIEGSPCLRCIVPSVPPSNVVPTCSRVGVLGAAVGVIGSVQAMEVIKIVVGLPTLVGSFFIYDALKKGTVSKVTKFNKDVDCRLCGSNPEIDVIEEESPPTCDIRDRFIE